jgi:hypothetical protein
MISRIPMSASAGLTLFLGSVCCRAEQNPSFQIADPTVHIASFFCHGSGAGAWEHLDSR